jgi:hypothetical protein
MQPILKFSTLEKKEKQKVIGIRLKVRGKRKQKKTYLEVQVFG